MAKNFCALCQKKLGGLWNGCGAPICDSEINKIASYYDVFPSAPYQQFSIGDKYVCGDCTEKTVNLFGCKIDVTSFPWKVCADSASEQQMNQAKQYVENRISTLPSGKEKDFFLYALEMPKKIIELRTTLPLRIKSIQDDLLLEHVAKYEVQKNIKIDTIKSQNQSAESFSYTFGIVDNNLLFVNYSSKSLEIEIQELKRNIQILYAQIMASKNFNCPECSAILQHCNENWTMLSFPLDRIKHFKMIGSIGYSSNVHGGGGSGGGVNMGGAIVGGVLFGGAGAIIGSQMGTEIHINEIETEVTQHDDRSVEFFYEDENEKTNSIIFDSSAYDCLMKLIPEKAFDSVVTNIHKKEEAPIATQPTSLSQMKELKELLDLGIITQEEFDAKKKQLLGL